MILLGPGSCFALVRAKQLCLSAGAVSLSIRSISLLLAWAPERHNMSFVISSRGPRLPARKIIASPLTKSKSLVQWPLLEDYISHYCTKKRKKSSPGLWSWKAWKENNTQNKQTSQLSPAWAKAISFHVVSLRLHAVTGPGWQDTEIGESCWPPSTELDSESLVGPPALPDCLLPTPAARLHVPSLWVPHSGRLPQHLHEAVPGQS